MKPLLALSVISVTVLAVGRGFAGQGIPRSQASTSPSAQATLAAFSSAQFPAFTNFFKAESASVQPVAFVVTNNSAKPIVGMAVRWVVTDSQGQPRAHVYHNHSFLTAHTPPVAPPHSKLLPTPGAFLPKAAPQPKLGGLTPDWRLIAEFGTAVARLVSGL